MPTVLISGYIIHHQVATIRWPDAKPNIPADGYCRVSTFPNGFVSGIITWYLYIFWSIQSVLRKVVS